MAMKKPVLSTNIIPTARIINETKSGVVYDRDNIDELCNKISLLCDADVRRMYGDNGYKAIINKYNWDGDKKIIADVINEFD
jgi:glycosyltransferase involved in cell wall biosynthesis